MSLTVAKATVMRDSQQQVISAEDLVPGDVVLLDEGDAVPADLRLVECSQLEIVESILTGESLPSLKNVEPINTRTRRLPIGDCAGNAFMSTVVARGRGVGLVVRTGEMTEIGRISSAIANQKEMPTPMQVRLARLGFILVLVSVALCILVVVIGIARRFNVMAMITLGISLAVSVIPEGLVAVTTITMAMGVRRMAAKHAIIRRLAGVEALGGITVICSDKTGTLTDGKMNASELWTAGGTEGTGYVFSDTTGQNAAYLKKDVQLTVVDSKIAELTAMTKVAKEVEKVNLGFSLSMMVCALCNNSAVHNEDGVTKFVGDPTEVALLVASIKSGLDKSHWTGLQGFRKLHEFAFDSDRKLMSVIYEHAEHPPVILAKGAPEALLEACTRRVNDDC